MQIIKILRGNQRNLNVVNIHLLLLDQIQQQVEGPLIHRYLYFVRRLRRGSLRLVARAHLRVLPRHLIFRRRHSFSLVAAGFFPPLFFFSFFSSLFLPPVFFFFFFLFFLLPRP